MRFKHFLLATACLATFTLGAGVAQADSAFTTSAQLKKQGIDTETFYPACFSPDGRSIMGVYQGDSEDIAKGEKYRIAILSLDDKGRVNTVRSYKVSVPHFEQITYTPDGKALVFTSRSGATFQKLDLMSGQVSTIMEHKFGTPGFRCYPLVMTLYQGQIVVQGYYYDEQDYAGRNAVATLDPTKTGVEAFTKVAEVQKAQNKARQGANFYHEDITSTKNAFFVETTGDKVDYYNWKIGDETLSLKTFDQGQEDMGMWGFNDRLLYSVKRGERDYDLVVYDANADKKTDLATETAKPYRNLFLSADGTTAMFSTFSQDNRRWRTHYAREGEGWIVKPIKGYNELSRGVQRISADGERMFIYNQSGLRVFDVE